MAPRRPCLECGTLTTRSRCPAHTPNDKARQARQPYRAPYATYAYKQARRAVLERDNHRCRALVDGTPCPRPAQEVHHIVPLSQGGDPTDPNNLVSVCRQHNPRGGRPRPRRG